MANRCKTCRHPDRKVINDALVGRAPYEQVSRDCGISPGALRSHFENHVRPELACERQAVDAARAADLRRQLDALHARTLAALERAEQEADARAMLLAIREVRANLVLLARSEVEAAERPAPSILDSPEWLRCQAALLDALAPFPEARVAAADRLAALGSIARPDL